MAKEKDTVQVTFRIEKKAFQKIEEFAEEDCIAKTDWIRRTLLDEIDDLETVMEDEAIEDYLKGRIGEEELKDYTRMKKIPVDLKEKRKEFLNSVIKDREK